jgi:hypothetical protein
MVFALRTPENLVSDGMYDLQWAAADEGAGRDIISCPILNNDEPLDCDSAEPWCVSMPSSLPRDR